MPQTPAGTLSLHPAKGNDFPWNPQYKRAMRALENLLKKGNVRKRSLKLLKVVCLMELWFESNPATCAADLVFLERSARKTIPTVRHAPGNS